MQSDAGNVASGLVLQQQIGIPSVTGGFALAVSGTDSTGATAQATDAQLTIAGFGQSSGTLDVNLGASNQTSPFSGASVTIANTSTGRGTASIAGATFNVYFISADRFLMLSSQPSNPVLSGAAERQCSDCSF
jgi:hypothetical protein